MSDYTKGTNFAAKDALLTGDANKVVSGTEIDDEFALVRVAVNSKTDETGGVLNTCDINNPDLDGGAIDGCTIGSNSPVTTLTVDNINVDGNTIVSTDTDGDISLTPNGAGRVNIDNGIDVTSSTGNNVVFKGANSTATGGFSFETDTTEVATIGVNGGNGQISISADPSGSVASSYIRLYTDGSERVRIMDDGKVGINKLAPTEQLEVDGNVKATAFIGDGAQLTNVKAGYSWTDAGTLSSGSTKDLSIDTTNISQIIVLVSGLQGTLDSTNDAWHIRLGTSGGIVETGYHGGFTANNSADSGGTTSAFTLIERYGSASETTCVIKLFNPTGNEWFLEANSYQNNGDGAYNAEQHGAVAAGHISLGGALTTVQLRAFGGAFSAGEIYYGTKED